MNQEQQMLIQDIMAGKITRKDIPAYAAAKDPNLRGLMRDRTFIGANSHISFEELSNSNKPESFKS